MFGPLPKEEVPRFLRKNQPDLMWQVCITRSRERAWLKPVCLTFCSGVWSLTRRERLAFAHTKPQLACLLSARWPPLAEEGSGFVFFSPFLYFESRSSALKCASFQSAALMCVCEIWSSCVKCSASPSRMKTAFVAGKTAAGARGKKERVEEGERVTVASNPTFRNPKTCIKDSNQLD